MPRTGSHNSPSASPLRAKLSTLFSRDVAPDSPRVQALWNAYQATGCERSLAALVEHYCPMVRQMAYRMQQNRPEFYADPREDLISDGCMGLLNAIRSCNATRGAVRRIFVRTAIVRAIRRETQRRHWMGRKRLDRLGVIEGIRSSLIQALGRMPTVAEMTAELANHVTNPQLYVGLITPAAMLGTFQEKDTERSARELPVDAPPDGPALEREAMALALKGLRGDDRRILRMLLAGSSPLDIAARVGIDRRTLMRRLNGVLWEARRRADLAAYLGIEPAESLQPSVKAAPVVSRIAG